jgi:hypothetical protein
LNLVLLFPVLVRAVLPFVVLGLGSRTALALVQYGPQVPVFMIFLGGLRPSVLKPNRDGVFVGAFVTDKGGPRPTTSLLSAIFFPSKLLKTFFFADL